MTPEHLNYYRQLSETKIYKDRFPELWPGDRWICRKNHLILGDNFIIIACQDCKRWENNCQEERRCIIPPVYDPENPERCLWGMVDWEKFTTSPNDDGTIDLYERYEGDYDPAHWHCWNDRLDIALIKAILKQEEAADGPKS
jgi:hypothetical protein